VRLASLLFGLFGCATLVDGGREEVRIDTEPDFAKAIVDGAVHPGDATVDLDRGRDHRVLLRKPGYEDRELAIRSGVSPWFWANFGFGPFFFVGMIVDAASGAMRRLDAKELRAELDPIATPRGEIARRGAAIDDAILHEKIALGDLAPLVGAEQERWVVAVVEGGGNVEPELLRAVTDQIRLFLAAREVRVVDRNGAGIENRELAALIESLKLESYEKAKRDECQIPLGAALPATHLLRTSLRRFGDACVTAAELIELETEVAARAVLEQSGCNPEELLVAVDRLSARLVRPSMTAGPVAGRTRKKGAAPQ
jgi:hypothetical protein